MSILSDIPIFAGLGQTELAAIESHASVRAYGSHALVVNEGDATDSLYVILSGEVKIFLNDEHGKEVVLNIQGAGEYFGELALFCDEKRSASIMTTKKSSFCIISNRDFSTILRQHPEIALNLIKHLSQRVRLLSENVKSLALLDVYGRIAKLLLSLAVQQEDGLIIENKPTQQDIANRVGASREMVSRILNDLMKGNYIKVSGSRIIINEKLPQRY